MSDRDYCLILVTAGTRTEAERIASTIIEERAAACANIYPIHSIYRWRGEVKNEPEWQIIFKTTANNFETIAARIGELHSYELPEIIAVPIVKGTADYLHWVSDRLDS